MQPRTKAVGLRGDGRRDRVPRSLAFLCALGLLALAPGRVSAQEREFTGRIDKISGSMMTVDNRMGDKVSFARVDETKVRGAKGQWGELRADDWVTVTWKFIDKPRVAYRVKVLPPKAGSE